MVASLSVLVVVTLLILTSRVATVALVGTGMSNEAAHFQARSALMGVGFTTHEAEEITAHPVRRKIVLWLMTFGNAGVITGITSLLLGFVNAESEQTLRRAVLLIGGLVVVWLLAASRRIERLLGRVAAAGLARFTDLDTRDYGSLLRLPENHGVVELLAQEGDWLTAAPLGELDLIAEGVLVLGVHRKNGDYVGVPGASTKLEPGDNVVVYGRVPTLRDLDDRHLGEAGDTAHRLAVDEQVHTRDEHGDNGEPSA